MIKLHRDVNRIMKKLSDKGFQCYAVGGCVRDCLRGEKPVDWDLATDARLDDLKSIFPEAQVLSEKLSVVRIDRTEDEDDEESIIADIATFRKDGQYKDGRRPATVEFVDDIETDLARRDFTINAMADNPTGRFVDPFGGREDMDKRLIRIVGDPMERLAENPIRIMRAIRLAAYTDYDIDGKTYSAMVANAQRMELCSTASIRDEFEKIIAAPYAGKGLKMLAAADLMQYIIGDLAQGLSRRQKRMFDELFENIDKTKRILQRRLCLFYMCIDDKKGKRAAERLQYDEDTQDKIEMAIDLNPKVYFIRNTVELKGFLAKYGPDVYEFVDNFSKADRIVHGYDETKIVARKHYMDMIVVSGEPVYVKDLAVNAKDLLDGGICKDEETADRILLMLTDVVHRKPSKNNKEELMFRAKRFSRNKFSAATRKVKWMR